MNHQGCKSHDLMMNYRTIISLPKSPFSKEMESVVGYIDVWCSTCQDSFRFQKDDTSSMAKRSPPTGAPKAAETPAAAPAVMKLRLR